jgi:hypothetical protein
MGKMDDARIAKQFKCPWNHGVLKCCGRIVCEQMGDDVSPIYCLACKEVGNDKAENLDFREDFNRVLNPMMHKWKLRLEKEAKKDGNAHK